MRNNKKVLLGALGALFVGQGALMTSYLSPLYVKNYAQKDQSQIAQSGLSPDQLLFVLGGFRELIAGILWVRADSFFDTGNYDAILPIIRLVTLLDPKQVDVYATGMWHIGYNFTDEESRSDRRYLPSALALGAEGAKQNPTTYELFFETGWIWYHKIDDNYDKAVKWMNDAQQREDMLPARRNILAMAYQRNGEIDKALDHYFGQYDRAIEAIKKTSDGKNIDFSYRQQRDTVENNIDTTIVRMAQRGHFGRASGEKVIPWDTEPPFDVGFSAQVTVVRPKVIRVRTTWNVRPLGTRIRFILRDENFPDAIPGGANWDNREGVNLDPPKDQTYLQEQLFVRNRRTDRTLDMSRDPTMYPFAQDNFLMEFYYNPRSAPPHIQDKFSWNGEGMTDKNFLRTDVRPGSRAMYTNLKLSKDQILRRGEWRDKVPVIQTSNWKEVGRLKGADDVIAVPNLLSTPENSTPK